MFSFSIFLYIFFTLFLVSTTAIIAHYMGKEILVAIYASLVIIAAVLARKLVVFGVLTIPSAVIVASSTFFATDILSELWGKQEAKKAVMAGFLSLIILFISQHIAISWESPIFAQEEAKHFNNTLLNSPRIVIASILGFLTSQFLDIEIFNLLKIKNKGQKLWLRSNSSTIASMLIDSLIFIPIAFGGLYPFSNIIKLILSMMCIKIIISFLSTPFFYFVIWFIKYMEKKSWKYENQF